MKNLAHASFRAPIAVRTVRTFFETGREKQLLCLVNARLRSRSP